MRCGGVASIDTTEEAGGCYCSKCYYEEAQSELVKLGVRGALDKLVDHLNSVTSEGTCLYDNCPVCDPRYQGVSGLGLSINRRNAKKHYKKTFEKFVRRFF